MKLSHCDWAPSCVADWLSKELDEKGLPGVTHTNSLLSLLHPYFCPHPVPIERSCIQREFLNSEGGHQSLIDSEPLQKFDRLLGEIEEYVHPDADFPQLITISDKEHNSKTFDCAEKQLIWKKFGKCGSSEKTWKLVALQFLRRVSEDHLGLEALVEELFCRLQKYKEESKSATNPVKSQKSEKSHCTDFAAVGFSGYSSTLSPAITQVYIENTNNSAHNLDTLYWSESMKSWERGNLHQRNSVDFRTTQPPEFHDKENNLEFTTDPYPYERLLSKEMEYTFKNDSLGSGDAKFIPNTSYESSKSKFSISPMLSSISRNSYINQSNFAEPSKNKEVGLEAWERTAPLFPEMNEDATHFSKESAHGRLFQRTASSQKNTEEKLSDVKDNYKVTPHPIDYLWDFQIANQGGEIRWNDLGGSLYSPQRIGLNSESSFSPDGNHLNFNGSAMKSAGLNYSNRDAFHTSNDHLKMSALSAESQIDWKVSHSVYDNRFPDNSCLTSTNEINPFLFDSNGKSYPPDFNSMHLKEAPHANNQKISNYSMLKGNGNEYSFTKDFINNSDDILCQSLRQLKFDQPDELENFEASLDNSFSPPNFLENKSDQSFSLDVLNSKMPNNTASAGLAHLSEQLIPVGPNGPSVYLRHSEGSGFSQVVPHGKQLSIFANSQNSSTVGKGDNISDLLSASISASEDENLLTSPRTHFKPIKHDSQGETDERLDESQISEAVEDPNLVFQRSGSGLLYLESDLMDGSPKKYMTFKEKIGSKLSTDEYQFQDADSTFVPKFKLVHNEKFCQTEEVSELACKPGTGWSSDSYLVDDTIMDRWNKHTENLKLIWGDKRMTDNNQKEKLWDFHEDDEDKVSNWFANKASCASDKGTLIESLLHGRLKDKQWQVLTDNQKNRSDSFNESLRKTKFLWKGSTAENTKSIPNYFNDLIPITNCNDSVVSSLNNHTNTCLSKNIWPSIGQEMQEVNCVESSSENDNGQDVSAKWHLQWSVDPDGEESMESFHSPSPLKALSPHSASQEEAFSSITSDDPSSLKAESDKIKFLEFLEREENQQPPLEDLERLEPDWNLNEGFEWGPETEQVFQCDEDEGGQEMLVYEREDGETVMLPVEYIDDSLYDQIFGGNDIPIGGSLPDLPGGQMGDIKKGNFKLSRRSRGSERFSSHLKRPCSFFLEGNCRRTDCKFSHDLSTITCRFWEEGSCFKGDTCPFRHGTIPSRRRNRSEGDQVSLGDVLSLPFGSLNEIKCSSGNRGKPVVRRNRSSATSVSSFELDSEADFPCLGSSVESKIGNLDDQTFISQVKITKKKKTPTIVNSKRCSKANPGITPTNGENESLNFAAPRNRKKSKSIRGEENGGSPIPIARNKKKKKKPKEGIDTRECDSLKRMLKKRFFSRSSGKLDGDV